MKVGVNLATELKEESIKRQVDFSDLLMEYMEEDILSVLYSGKYGDKLWLITGAQGDVGCEGKVSFYYKDEKAKLTEEIVEGILAGLGGSSEINWMYNIRAEGNGFRAELFGEYKEMQLPLVISFMQIENASIKPTQREWSRILKKNKTIKYWAYSPESRMCEALYEIMDKLELIGDIKTYYVVNDILKSSSISGRHIIEELSSLAEKTPKVLKEKRIDQIKSYRSYGYMKKRWNAYCKKLSLNQDQSPEEWEEALDRIVSFAEPIWRALCNNEVFFDDWMPELGRFLG